MATKEEIHKWILSMEPTPAEQQMVDAGMKEGFDKVRRDMRKRTLVRKQTGRKVTDSMFPHPGILG